MTGPRYGVLAATIERARMLFRQLGWEEGHDLAFRVSKFGNEARGINLDVLVIDESALPLPERTWATFAPTLAHTGGTAYVLRSMTTGDVASPKF